MQDVDSYRTEGIDDTLDIILKALSNRGRRHILLLLKERKLTVTEIVEATGLPQIFCFHLFNDYEKSSVGFQLQAGGMSHYFVSELNNKYLMMVLESVLPVSQTKEIKESIKTSSVA